MSAAPESQTPEHTLELAERAYEAGNFARVRVLCDSAAASPDAALAARVAALRARVSADPVALCVLVAAFVLFGVIVDVYVL
jgi:hypothetical protein